MQSMTATETKVEVEITGIAPLMQNNPASRDKQAGSSRKVNTNGHNAKEDPEQWRDQVYPMGEGKLGHPGEAIEECLRIAARDFKADKRRTMQAIIKSTCFVEERLVELVDKSKPDAVERFWIPVQMGGGRVAAYRPLFSPGWKIKFVLHLMDIEIAPLDRVREILDHAGRRMGLGCHRPKYGRFMVTSFQELK